MRHAGAIGGRHGASGSSIDGWIVVAGSVLGLMVGGGVVRVFAYSVLLKPTAAGTGLSREAIGLAFLIGNIVAVVVTPVFGRLIDLYGIRKISVPSVLLWAVSMAAFALLSPRTSWLIYPLYIASGVFGIAQTGIGYSKAITSWFDARRGLALGIGVSGVGIGGFIMPYYLRWVDTAYGWRAAYLAIGVAIAVVAAPAFAFLVRTRPDTEVPGGGEPTRLTRAELAQEMLRSRHFWTLAIIFLVAASALTGIVGHLMAMLTDRGISSGIATTALSLIGITLIAGRVGGGYLLDRFYPPAVATAILLIPALSCAILATNAGEYAIIVAAVGLGIGLGAELDILGYLTSRYFSLRGFGTIYGALFSMVTLGTAGGPFLVSVLAADHGYPAALVVAGAALVACGLLALTLGSKDRQTEADRPAGPAGRLAPAADFRSDG
jgi:predicted MFS family arabinose efflux permease